MDERHRQIAWVFGGPRSPGSRAVIIELGSGEDDATWMQQTAHAAGAPATVFLRRQGSSARARFFTSARELPFCGHGALGAAAHLMRDGLSSIVLEATGQRPSVSRDGELLVLAHAGGTISELPMPAELLDALGLERTQIIRPLCVGSIGSPKAIVEIDSVRTLTSMAPNFGRLLDWSRKTQINGAYVIVRVDRTHARARSFNPSSGAEEDPATGTAAGALVAVLPDLKADQWLEIRQGPREDDLCELFARRTGAGSTQVAGRVRLD